MKPRASLSSSGVGTGGTVGTTPGATAPGPEGWTIEDSGAPGVPACVICDGVPPSPVVVGVRAVADAGRSCTHLDRPTRISLSHDRRGPREFVAVSFRPADDPSPAVPGSDHHRPASPDPCSDPDSALAVGGTGTDTKSWPSAAQAGSNPSVAAAIMNFRKDLAPPRNSIPHARFLIRHVTSLHPYRLERPFEFNDRIGYYDPADFF